MIVLDLFCGTKSIANAFKRHGHTVYTVDWDKRFNPTLQADISKLTTQDIIKLCGGVLRTLFGLARIVLLTPWQLSHDTGNGIL